MGSTTSTTTNKKKPKASSSSSSASSNAHDEPSSLPSPHGQHDSSDRDIQPEGGRLLLPFLAFTDRLRLSECSQGLINYRYYLSKVKIRQMPLPISGLKVNLNQLISGQRQLQYLRVGSKCLLSVLDLASEGCFKRLKTLDLSGLCVTNCVGHVTGALQGGGMEQGAHDAIFTLLKDGACPRLRHLDLTGLHYEVAVLIEALESVHLRQLQELVLADKELVLADSAGRGRVSSILMALQRGACPQLVTLDLSRCDLRPEDGQALAEAMRSGNCAKLERLNLGNNRYMDDEGFGFMAIFGALEAGSCPLLKHLDLAAADLSRESALALDHALRSGYCPHLQGLDLPAVFAT